MLGSLKLCDLDLVEVLIKHLKTAHGKVTTWDESQMAEYSNLLGKRSLIVFITKYILIK